MSKFSSKPELSISIVTYNRCSFLKGCLTSLFALRGEIAFEVIVVDNGSTDGTTAMIAEYFPAVHLIHNERNLGFGRPHNQAFKESQGRYFLLLNDDTLLPPGVLKAMVNFMEERADAAVCTPRLQDEHGRVQSSVFMRFPGFMTSLVTNSSARLVFERIFKNRDYPGRFPAPEPASDEPQNMPHVIGACFMVRSLLYRKMGMLDERFFIYREETDLCKRLRQDGWNIYYLPAVVITHYGGGGKFEPGREEFRVLTGVESEWIYHCKHYGMLSGYLLVILNLLAISASFLLMAFLKLLFFRHPHRSRFLSVLMSGSKMLLRGFLSLLFFRRPIRHDA